MTPPDMNEQRLARLESAARIAMDYIGTPLGECAKPETLTAASAWLKEHTPPTPAPAGAGSWPRWMYNGHNVYLQEGPSEAQHVYSANLSQDWKPPEVITHQRAVELSQEAKRYHPLPNPAESWPVDVVKGSPIAHNMAELGLRRREFDLWAGLMCWGDDKDSYITSDHWPESLTEYVKSGASTIGLCGDVLGGFVADWIKGKRAPYVVPASPASKGVLSVSKSSPTCGECGSTLRADDPLTLCASCAILPKKSACRACGRPLDVTTGVADGCECNAPRGVNHGLVPTHICTCPACDPEETGSTRKPPIHANKGEEERAREWAERIVMPHPEGGYVFRLHHNGDEPLSIPITKYEADKMKERIATNLLAFSKSATDARDARIVALEQQVSGYELRVDGLLKNVRALESKLAAGREVLK